MMATNNLAQKLSALVSAMNEGAARMVAAGTELPAIGDSLKVARLMREVRDLLNKYLEEPAQGMPAMPETQSGSVEDESAVLEEDAP